MNTTPSRSTIRWTLSRKYWRLYYVQLVVVYVVYITRTYCTRQLRYPMAYLRMLRCDRTENTIEFLQSKGVPSFRADQ